MKNRLHRLFAIIKSEKFVLAFLTVCYVVAYFQYGGTPGNSPSNALGWWGWYDQGRYLDAVNAFSVADLSPERHTYPPLYPLIGAIFVKWSSGHPYFFVNLACLLWAAYVFLRLCDRFFIRSVSVFLVFFSFIISPYTLLNYVIPWTSTMGVALISCGVLGLVWADEAHRSGRVTFGQGRLFFVSVALGLLVPLRPADALVGAIILLGVLYSVWQINSPERYFSTAIKLLIIAFLGWVIGPILFVAFNLMSFGAAEGSYFKMATSNGLFIQDIPEKFYSLWIDSYPLYLEPGLTLLSKYPWFVFSLSGLCIAIVYGNVILRTLVAAIVVHFIVYMSYADLVPSGLFRYLNIHYFKWLMPFMAFFAWYGLRCMFGRSRASKKIVAARCIVSATIILILLFRMDVREMDVTDFETREVDERVMIIFNSDEAMSIDGIDMAGLWGGFNEVYFGAHAVVVDGNRLSFPKDFRLISSPTGVRLLFTRPVNPLVIEFTADSRLNAAAGSVAITPLYYEFSLGLPRFLLDAVQYYEAVPYAMGSLVDFSALGNGHLFTKAGWSSPEQWGVWTVGKEAVLAMSLDQEVIEGSSFSMRCAAFLSEEQPKQTLLIKFNGIPIHETVFDLNQGGGSFRDIEFDIEEAIPIGTGDLTITFSTPDAIESPSQSGSGLDDRILGIAVKQLSLK